MAVDIKQAARRLIEEVFGKGNFDAFDEICDAGYRAHDPVKGDSDLRQAKENCRMYKTAFPDLKPTILGCFAEGDTVVTYWRMTGTHQQPLMSIQPTGKPWTVEVMSIGRFRGGKLAEEYGQWDDGGSLALGLLCRMGAAPSLEMGTAGAWKPHLGLHDLVERLGALELGATGARKRHLGLHDLVEHLQDVVGQLAALEVGAAGAQKRHPGLRDLVEQLGAHA